jgi:hypothetical protein
MSADPEMLLVKIKALSLRRQAEVEDFVDFLRARERTEAAERLGQTFDKLDALDEPALPPTKSGLRLARHARRDRRWLGSAREPAGSW